MQANRRKVLGSALAALATPSIARAQAASAHVVVVGGGFGGGTVARYLRQLAPRVQVEHEVLLAPRPYPLGSIPNVNT